MTSRTQHEPPGSTRRCGSTSTAAQKLSSPRAGAKSTVVVPPEARGHRTAAAPASARRRDTQPEIDPLPELSQDDRPPADRIHGVEQDIRDDRGSTGARAFILRGRPAAIDPQKEMVAHRHQEQAHRAQRRDPRARRARCGLILGQSGNDSEMLERTA
ncbi:hypothetical protein [Streptomyces glycanivorans]|uniref:Uncharacterized protein n=1 Tax=Streptomyces glycanivorans TaxID=3033808 RepID=A0ABY9J8N6_9ACTN|nr:hypothetical protein [Streptomyces sp. Alt3]WLQ63026.1 hypothetical protein P8A20_05180 [Streptomyces sp. Alt3]